MNKVDIGMWQTLNNELLKLNFGIDPEVSFFSLELKKEITRRFSFQSMDFIPSVELPNNTVNTVSYGD